MSDEHRRAWPACLRRGISAPSGATILALALILLGVCLRLEVAAQDLQSPLIDENEVVEQAVAFMGGELHQYFVKYGPLTMYLLAGIYRGVALLRGMSALEYGSLVFFHGEQHYFIARALVRLALSALALYAFFIYRKRLGATPALVACALLGLPLVDGLVSGARIDMLQAAFQGLALLALGEVAYGASRGYWLAAGAAAGLAIATKPLPGLLVLPCFPVASWFAAGLTAPGAARPRLLARCLATLKQPGLWLAALAVIACAVLCDPAIVHLADFIRSQREAIALHSDTDLAKGPSVFTSFATRVGVAWCAAVVLSALAAVVRRDARAWLLIVFIAVYVGAFFGRSRHYFLVAPAVAGCLLIGVGVAAARDLADARTKQGSAWARRLWVPLVLALLAPALLPYVGQAEKQPVRTQARDWIYQNIPAGTRLYYVGWRGSGPALVADNATTQAKFGDHFGYQRDHYEFLKRAFQLGYAEYEKSGAPRYEIASYHNKPFPRKSRKTPRSITDSLLKDARAQKRRYIIIAGYPEANVLGLGYTWFPDAVLEKEFAKIAIFRVP
jgi:hypothetical protein